MVKQKYTVLLRSVYIWIYIKCVYVLIGIKCLCDCLYVYISIKYLLSSLSCYEYLARVDITEVVFLLFLTLRGRLVLFIFSSRRKYEGQSKDLNWESILS